MSDGSTDGKASDAEGWLRRALSATREPWYCNQSFVEKLTVEQLRERLVRGLDEDGWIELAVGTYAWGLSAEQIEAIRSNIPALSDQGARYLVDRLVCQARCLRHDAVKLDELAALRWALPAYARKELDRT